MDKEKVVINEDLSTKVAHIQFCFDNDRMMNLLF